MDKKAWCVGKIARGGLSEVEAHEASLIGTIIPGTEDFVADNGQVRVDNRVQHVHCFLRHCGKAFRCDE